MKQATFALFVLASLAFLCLVTGSPQGLRGNNDLVTGSPQGLRGNNDLVTGSPQGLRGNNDLVTGSPQGLRGNNDLVTGSPQGLRGNNDGDSTDQHQSRQLIILWNPTPPPRSTTTVAPRTTTVSRRTTACPCVTTGEYNPLCGTDNVTYSNPGRLQCAINCGTRVSLMHYGVCRT